MKKPLLLISLITSSIIFNARSESVVLDDESAIVDEEVVDYITPEKSDTTASSVSKLKTFILPTEREKAFIKLLLLTPSIPINVIFNIAGLTLSGVGVVLALVNLTFGNFDSELRAGLNKQIAYQIEFRPFDPLSLKILIATLLCWLPTKHIGIPLNAYFLRSFGRNLELFKNEQETEEDKVEEVLEDIFDTVEQAL